MWVKTGALRKFGLLKNAEIHSPNFLTVEQSRNLQQTEVAFVAVEISWEQQFEIFFLFVKFGAAARKGVTAVHF